MPSALQLPTQVALLLISSFRLEETETPGAGSLPKGTAPVSQRAWPELEVGSLTPEMVRGRMRLGGPSTFLRG